MTLEHQASPHAVVLSASTTTIPSKPSWWTRFRRRLLIDVVLQRWFDNVVLVVIAANCVTLALDQPLDDPASPKQVFVQRADKVWWVWGRWVAKAWQRGRAMQGALRKVV